MRSRGFFRKQPTKNVPLPQEKSGNGDQRDKDKANLRSVVRKVFKRAIDIAQDRNTRDEMNGALESAFCDIGHGGMSG